MQRTFPLSPSALAPNPPNCADAEFADFDRCGFGAKPVQKPHPPIFFSGRKDRKRSASRIAKYGLSGWIEIQDTPAELKQWRGAIQRELEELGRSRSVDGLEICNMLWFVITGQETDQTPHGKASNLLVGTAAQITDNLIFTERCARSSSVWERTTGSCNLCTCPLEFRFRHQPIA